MLDECVFELRDGTGKNLQMRCWRIEGREIKGAGGEEGRARAVGCRKWMAMVRMMRNEE